MYKYLITVVLGGGGRGEGKERRGGRGGEGEEGRDDGNALLYTTLMLNGCGTKLNYCFLIAIYIIFII